MNRKIALLGLIVLLVGLLAGCDTPVPEATEPPPTEAPTGGEFALRITGNVGAEMGWTEEEVLAMDTITVQSTNREGQLQDYTGVSLSALLALAAPGADATTLTYVADDGYTAEAALADVLACTDCIVSFRNQGGFSIVMPGFPNNVQVKGVIEIQVQ